MTSSSEEENGGSRSRSVSRKRGRTTKKSSSAKVPKSEPPTPSSSTKQSRNKQRKQDEVQMWNGYTLQFQNDDASRKSIHPAVQRFTMKLMGQVARDTTASVSSSLKEDGEMEESRKVQVYSSQHVNEITARLRKQLREVKIPTRYVKIEDLNLTALPNDRRRQEIQVSLKMEQKLDVQRSLLQEEYDNAKAQRDLALKKMSTLANDSSSTNTASIHPFLLESTKSHSSELETSRSDNATSAGVGKSAQDTDGQTESKKNSLSMLLQDMSSPYG